MISRVLVPRDGSEMAEHVLADDIEQAAEEHAEPVFARARETLDRAGDFDAVVIGSHGGSLTDRLLTGNVAERVVRVSPVPVTVVR